MTQIEVDNRFSWLDGHYEDYDNDGDDDSDHHDHYHHGHLQKPLLFQIGRANASKAAAIPFSSAAPQTPAVLLIIANF